MIIDKLVNSEIYYGLGSKFKKAFSVLKELNLEEMDCGRYEIDGKNIYMIIMEYKTKRQEDCQWEAHRKYVDIQYIIYGKENMGYVEAEKISKVKEYDKKDDILFGKANGNFFDVEKGKFVIFTPSDGHMPSLLIDKIDLVKKVVVKISID